jgi:hypothetical protein
MSHISKKQRLTMQVVAIITISAVVIGMIAPLLSIK